MARFIHKTGLAAEACISSQDLEEGNPSPLSEVPVPGTLSDVEQVAADVEKRDLRRAAGWAMTAPGRCAGCGDGPSW